MRYLFSLAPTAPPRDFFVTALNRTAIEAEWDLPPADDRGGIILGYKLFIQSTNGGAEWTINITDNSTVFIVGGLQPDTAYILSVLAYTSVGDGPWSIRLTVSTLSKNHGEQRILLDLLFICKIFIINKCSL